MSYTEYNNALVKRDAFRNILTHSLRFGHPSLSKLEEVLGILLGEIKENTLIIKNAIPILHGDHLSIDSNTSLKHYLSKAHEKYSAATLEILGLYTSHFQTGKSLNERDLQNLLYLQTKINPNAIFININTTTQLDEKNKFGLSIFRLKEPAKGLSSDYEKVDFEIETPNSLEVFKWVQKFVEDYQKEKPILIGEDLDEAGFKRDDLQAIPLTEEGIEDKYSSQDLIPDASSEIVDSTLNLFTNQINQWFKKLNSALMDGSKELINSFTTINTSLPKGIDMVNKHLLNQINELVERNIGTVNRYFNELQNFEDIIRQLTHKFNSMQESITNIITKQIDEDISKNQQELSQIEDKIVSQERYIKNMQSLIENFKNINDETQTIIENNKSMITRKLEEYQEKSHHSKSSAIDKVLNTIKEMEELIREKSHEKLTKLSELNEDLKDFLK
ncbi:MAG: hypothetical protein BAJALOKI1v1_240023 [Promethearchaeota archaeon]|nr:MAG: hypothetical protein BAJALOKI1v1_240023 [Candidatus Lokiarchaeota archaeon]